MEEPAAVIVVTIPVGSLGLPPAFDHNGKKHSVTPATITFRYRLGDPDPDPVNVVINGPAIPVRHFPMGADADNDVVVYCRNWREHWPDWLAPLAAKHRPRI